MDILGDPACVETPPDLPTLRTATGEHRRYKIPIAKQAAHVYTECARIWNPVHTDRRVALAAGLPEIILHGTATMALAVSKIIDEILAGDSARITRLGGRFRAMVLMPSILSLAVQQDTSGIISYTVFTEDNEPAVSQGFVCYR